MTFGDFNLYLKGYKEREYKNQVDIMSLAYNSGMFSKETKSRPKKLEYYIKQIDKKFHGDELRRKPVDKEMSNHIIKEIEKLKELREIADE